MWLVIEDHDNLFIMAEFVHFAGIGMLLYKLFSKKNAGGNHETYLDNLHTPILQGPCTCMSASVGLSLRTQELTALFLGVRLVCRYMLQATTVHPDPACSVQICHRKHAPQLCQV